MSLRDSNLFLCSRKETQTAIGIATETLPGTGIPSCPGGIHLEDACRVGQLIANMLDMIQTGGEVGSLPPTFAACERVQWPCARGHRAPMSRRSEHLFGLGDGVRKKMMVTGVVRTKGKRIWLIIVKQCYLSRKNTTKSWKILFSFTQSPAGMDPPTHPKPTLRFWPPFAGRYTEKWRNRNSTWHMLSAGLNEKMQTMGADFGVIELFACLQILWKISLFQLKILR